MLIKSIGKVECDCILQQTDDKYRNNGQEPWSRNGGRIQSILASCQLKLFKDKACREVLLDWFNVTSNLGDDLTLSSGEM